MVERPTIGVTVIGGYLGAGKTTLVNHLLRTADARLAVLVNDFGSVNIDADLITSHDGSTMELANGCICCSLVDGFAAALTTIDELEPRPERLVIEASGVADPATVAAYAHAPGLALDAVVVVVDAETVRTKATDGYVGDTVLGQLTSADLLVVNKVDLVTPDELDKVQAWLTERRPEAAQVPAVQSQVPPGLLFGVEIDRTHQPRHRSDHGDHAEFESWSWVGGKPVDRAKVEAMMDALPDTVLRLKGTLTLNDHAVPHVLQRVGRRWTLRPDPGRAPSHNSRLVAIGKPGAITSDWLASHLDL